MKMCPTCKDIALSPWWVNPRRLACDVCGYLEPYQIKTLCAWCGVTVKEGPDDGRVSHGICPACVEKHFPEVSREVPK